MAALVDKVIFGAGQYDACLPMSPQLHLIGESTKGHTKEHFQVGLRCNLDEVD